MFRFFVRGTQSAQIRDGGGNLWRSRALIGGTIIGSAAITVAPAMARSVGDPEVPLPKGLSKLMDISKLQMHPKCLQSTAWLRGVCEKPDTIIVEGVGAAAEVANIPGGDDHLVRTFSQTAAVPLCVQ